MCVENVSSAFPLQSAILPLNEGEKGIKVLLAKSGAAAEVVVDAGATHCITLANASTL